MVASFVSAGAGVVAAAGSVTPAYPGSLQAGDLLIIHIMVEMTSVTVDCSGSGFALLNSRNSAGSGNNIHRGEWWYKWSDGTETGTATVGVTGGTSTFTYAQMCAIRGVDGSPGRPSMSSESITNATTTQVTHPTIVASRAGSLGFVFHTQGDDNNDFATALAGATGGTWVRRWGARSNLGNDGGWFFNTVDMPNPAIPVSGGLVVTSNFPLVTYAGVLLAPVVEKTPRPNPMRQLLAH